MDILEQGMEILRKIPRRYYLPLGAGCIGLILLGYGFFNMLGQSHSRENNANSDFSQQVLASPQPSSAQANSATIDFNAMVVDVEGAVVSPGVYHLSADSRVQDALVAAGGLSGNADRKWVEQHINLALKISDGTKVYIPRIGEIVQTENEAGINTRGGGIGNESNGVININSASLDSLDSLPGVGQVTAQKIISGRPYATVADLLHKGIIGEKEYEKIKDLVVAQ